MNVPRGYELAYEGWKHTDALWIWQDPPPPVKRIPMDVFTGNHEKRQLEAFKRFKDS